MDAHIDWLSWTQPTKTEPRDHAELYERAKLIMRDTTNGNEGIVWNGQGFEASGSRTPYSLAIQREDHGAMVYGRSHTSTVLYELTGRGCEPLRRENMGQEFIAYICERVTRFDVAVDVRCSLSPSDFANHRSHQRFRGIGYIRSQSGETVYVGSAKSDRFCRVYRYNKPHPRSDLLRIEFVFRRGMAKATAHELVGSSSLADFAARCGVTWGFNHPVWKPEHVTNEKLLAPIVLRGDSDTLAWLYKQVAPAMARLVSVGALDMTDFLETVYDQASLPDQ